VQRSAARAAADRGWQGARDRCDDGQAHRFAAERSADRRYGEGLRYGALADAYGAGGHAAPDHRPALQRGRGLTFAGDLVFQVGFEHPDWYNGFEHDPEEAARVRVRLLRELAANRESLVATHLSFPSVCHVAVAGDVFRWVPGPWEY